MGEEEIEIYNQIAAQGDEDTLAYNERIYKPYLSKYVCRGANMDRKKYRLSELIVPNYVSL
jgi:hypothetical protein